MDVFFPHIRLRGHVAALHRHHLRLGSRLPRGGFHLGPVERRAIFSPPGIGDRVDDPVQAGHTRRLPGNDYVREVARMSGGGEIAASVRVKLSHASTKNLRYQGID